MANSVRLSLEHCKITMESLLDQLKRCNIDNVIVEDDNIKIPLSDIYNMVIARCFFYANPNYHDDDGDHEDCIYCVFDRYGTGDDHVDDFHTFMSIKYPHEFDPELGTYRNLVKGCSEWGELQTPEFYTISADVLTVEQFAEAERLGKLAGKKVPELDQDDD